MCLITTSFPPADFSSTRTSIPACNIRETADNYEVELAEPGMGKSDFNVPMDGNLLSISSERSPSTIQIS